MTSTHTLATLDISSSAYHEVTKKLDKAGQYGDRAVMEGELELGVDMSGIMLTPNGEFNAKLEASLAEAMAIQPEQPPAQYSLDNPPKGYEKLASVLTLALKQASEGKGKKRHAVGDTPFDRQPIMELPRMVGPSGTAYQVMKKTQEAMRMDAGPAVAELLGAINYACATILIIQENEQMAGRVAAGDDPIPSFLTRNKGS